MKILIIRLNAQIVILTEIRIEASRGPGQSRDEWKALGWIFIEALAQLVELEQFRPYTVSDLLINQH